MAYEFHFPDVAEGITEGKLVAWKIKQGDFVKEDQPICDIETDKSVVEIPSPTHGVASILHYKEGDMVKVHTVLVTFDSIGEKVQSASPSTAQRANQAPQEPAQVQRPMEKNVVSHVLSSQGRALPKTRKLAEQLGVDLSRVQGSGPDGIITEFDVQALAGKNSPSAKTAQVSTPSPQIVHADPAQINGTPNHRLSPSMRKHIREEGVPMGQVVPAFSSQQSVQQVSPLPVVQAVPILGAKRVKFEGIREAIRKKMAHAWATIPHSSIVVDVEIDGLIEERQKAKPILEKQQIKLTYLAYIAKVCALAIKQFPNFAVQVDDTTTEMVSKDHINIGIAVDTPNGLIVPNIKDCEKKSIAGIAKEIQDLAEKARQKKLSLQEITGGTFTITNLGSFGAKTGFSIINHPEVAILGVGTIEEKLTALDGKFVVKHIMPLTLTIDHRVLDGADAGRFLAWVGERLKNPPLLLLDVQ